MGDSAGSSSSSSSSSPSSSSLDYALLESLFYNEMMLMDDSSYTSGDIGSYLSSPDNGDDDSTPDATTIAERAILSDFGVAANANHHHHHHHQKTTTAAAAPPQPIYSNGPSNVASKPVVVVAQASALSQRLGVSFPPKVLSSQPVQQLQNTAEAAIAAVTMKKKRPPSEEQQPVVDHNGKVYSRRRKKPRLAECEAKLASLKAENEMLTRHLANVTNRSEKFEEARKKKEDEMKRLMEQGADPEQIRTLLGQYSAMYSDYGRHRDEELSFHLQQLQRLAAPANFTKMGLWTLGQNDKFYTDLKRNPIAGILQKELAITPQQGRKILEKRQKIRELCSKLKNCLGLLAKLKSICDRKQRVYHDRLTKCQEILTPEQVIRLVLWVDDHTQVLERVCPGWGSEMIQAKKAKP